MTGHSTEPDGRARVARRCAAAWLALALGVAPWCGARAQSGVTAGEILIGQVISLNGGRNEYGADVQRGMRAKFDEVNAGGGIFGRRIRIVQLDDEGAPAQAERHARQLIDQDRVFALFGSLEGGPSVAIMEVAVERNVPFFGPLAGSPELRDPHQPLVFPWRAAHREEFRKMLQHASASGIRRIAFFRSDSGTGEKHLANVKLIARELGMEVVDDLPFKSEMSDAAHPHLPGRLCQGASRCAVQLRQHGGLPHGLGPHRGTATGRSVAHARELRAGPARRRAAAGGLSRHVHRRQPPGLDLRGAGAHRPRGPGALLSRVRTAPRALKLRRRRPIAVDMDFLMLPAGLALFAFAAVAAGRVAWKRGRRGVGAHGGMDAHGKPPPPLQRKPAHQVAAAAVIEQAQARAAAQVAPVQAAPGPANGPAPQAVTQFDGPGWAATQPMSGVAVEFAFADTMPAGLNAGAPNFADTMPAEMGLAATNFAATNFADTLAVELAAEEPPVAKLGTGRRPA